MNYLETDKNYIIDSKEVILDDPTSKLLIPIFYKESYAGKIELSFPEDENVIGGSIATNADGEVMRIRCTNFTNPLGQSTAIPIRLGKINGKAISMQVWSALSDKHGVRRVKYTMFLEK